MVFGLLPLVILAAIPTASVKPLGVKVQRPVRFFKLKHQFTGYSTIYSDFFFSSTTTYNNIFTRYLPPWLICEYDCSEGWFSNHAKWATAFGGPKLFRAPNAPKLLYKLFLVILINCKCIWQRVTLSVICSSLSWLMHFYLSCRALIQTGVLGGVAEVLTSSFFKWECLTYILWLNIATQKNHPHPPKCWL